MNERSIIHSWCSGTVVMQNISILQCAAELGWTWPAMRVSRVYEFALGRWRTWEKLYSWLIIHMSSTGNAEKLSAVTKAVVIESAVTPKSAWAVQLT